MHKRIQRSGERPKEQATKALREAAMTLLQRALGPISDVTRPKAFRENKKWIADEGREDFADMPAYHPAGTFRTAVVLRAHIQVRMRFGSQSASVTRRESVHAEP